MTEPRSPPKRCWRRWTLFAFFCVTTSAAILWSNRQERAIHAWLTLASHDHPLVMKYETVCIIPGVDHERLREFLGRRQISVVVFNPGDADKLLAMPPCPVKLIVDVGLRTPLDDITRLRDRFGHAVQ